MKKMNKYVSYVLVLTVMGASITIAKPNYSYSQTQPAYGYPQAQMPSSFQPQSNYYTQSQYYDQNSTLKGRVVTVPAGATMNAVVTTPLSSANMTTGQCVTMMLSSDFYNNGTLIAPSGSTVMGTVVVAKSAKRGSINGQLNIKFTEITTPYGSRIPISACIKTEDGTGLLRGGTKMDTTKDIAKNMVAGSAAGALTGLIASSIADGSIGKGTAIMTGVGAGAGLIKSGFDKGVDVTIPVNSSIELMIDQPITVSPATNSYNY